MIPSSYEGPRNGDYVAYVDELLRASPEFRRTQKSIAGAIQTAVITPGVQSNSPIAQLREALQKARDMVEQAQRNQAGRPAPRTASSGQQQGKALTKDEARQRFKAMEREMDGSKAQLAGKPWVSPFSLALIVGGVIISQFVPGFGAVLSIMGLMTAVGSVLNRLKGK